MISAAQIRAGRALIGAKQSELADAAGISLATLNNIERGIGDPRSSTLEAIEQALKDAGVEVEEDGVTETVRLVSLARPSAYDTFFASQRVLEALTPKSLLQPQRILFYVRRSMMATGSEDRHRIAILIEGRARSLLFDQVEFSLTSGARTAEVAGIMLAAMGLHPGATHFLEQVLEDTSVTELAEVVRRLRSWPWREMTHPRDFIDLFDDWDRLLERHGSRADHPLSRLARLADALQPPPAFPAAEPVLPEPLPSEPRYALPRTDAEE